MMIIGVDYTRAFRRCILLEEMVSVVNRTEPQ